MSPQRAPSASASSRPPGRPAWPAVLVPVTLVIGLAGGCAGSPPVSPVSTAAQGDTMARVATLGDEVAAPQWAAQRTRGILRVLGAQAHAAVSGERAGYLAPVAGATERRRAGERFERMTRIGLAELGVVAVDEITPPVPVRGDEAVTWDVEATFAYRIRGFDRAPRRFALDLTLSAEPDRPDHVTILGSRPADRPQPWDLDGLLVRRSRDALVLGVRGGADVDEVLRRADHAAQEVSKVWGTAVPAVWIAPATTTDAERLLGRTPGQLSGVAAVTDGPLEAGSRAGADRIVVVPGAWAALRPVGRDVVMTHELTHVAVRASTTRPVPLWLSEGFAEYVAYRDVTVPERAVATELIDRMRADGPPAHLPGPERFDPSSGTLPVAYAEAWLAVRELVSSHGEARVVALYRAAAGGVSAAAPADDPETAVDAALAAVLGTTRAQLERRWVARLRALL